MTRAGIPLSSIHTVAELLAALQTVTELQIENEVAMLRDIVDRGTDVQKSVARRLLGDRAPAISLADARRRKNSRSL